jgi:uncharacterized protein (TIGR02996 family)
VLLLHEAFLSDVSDNPGDDAPRLIYADWLDDQGGTDNPRAEFIRLQCRRSRLPSDHPEQQTLAARESELLDRHERAWRAELPHLEDITWEDFERGFIEAVFAAEAEAFLYQAPAIFAAAPIRRVQVGRIDLPDAGLLAGSPWLARLTELNLGNSTGLCPEGLRALTSSPHLANLTALLLHYNPLGDEGAAQVGESLWLGRLRELYLSGTELGDLGVHTLASAGGLPLLTDLDLRDNRLTDAGARSLAFNRGLEQISTLWLVNNQIGEAGAEALAWTENLPHLRHLYLNYNPIGNAGAAAFATGPHCRALVELDLRHCRIRDAGARALAASPYLDQLQLLWLSGNRLRMETLTLLRRRFGDRLRI